VPAADASAAPAVLTLVWSRLGDRDCLRITGWSAATWVRLRDADHDGLASWFPVFPTEAVIGRDARDGPGFRSSLPSTAGRYFLDGDTVCFVPRFPILGGASYTLLVAPGLVDPDRAGFDVDVTEFAPFTVVKPAEVRASTTEVVAIHPSAPTIPRNVLRMYIEFSAPMSEGRAADFVRVRRADTGDVVPHAFLPFDPELWDGNRRRLTVLFDPGRIKRGLSPHEAVGYPLEEGLDVELVVDARYPDASGAALVRGRVQQFHVGPDLRGRADPSIWSLRAPEAGTTQPLVVDFDRPLDHALLDRCLSVVDDAGERVPGRAETQVGERSWALRPVEPWSARRHDLVVRTILEDVAGNSVARVFDRDLALVEHDPLDADRVVRSFVPRA
jgi:hypothetical protein